VDTGAQLRTVTGDVEQCHTIASVERCLGRAGCVAEDRHQAVAEPLHHLASSRQDRRLDRFPHFAEESDGELVSRFQRPLGEAHEVREEDRHVHFAPTSTLCLGKSLPALKNRGAQLTGNARFPGSEGRELTERDVGGTTANAGQPVLDLLLAEWAADDDRKQFLEGLADVDARARAASAKDFLAASEAQRAAILTALDAEAQEGRRAKSDAHPHFFERMKFLTVYGYCTSEVGATAELHYEVIPGSFDGCTELGRWRAAPGSF